MSDTPVIVTPAQAELEARQKGFTDAVNKAGDKFKIAMRATLTTKEVQYPDGTKVLAYVPALALIDRTKPNVPIKEQA